MARVFSIATVVRRLPVPLLREFLTGLGHPDLTVDWGAFTSARPDPVVDALNALPDAAFDAVETAFHAAHDLACEAGAAALAEAAGVHLDHDFADRVPADSGLTERAVWALTHAPAVAELAGMIHYVEAVTAHDADRRLGPRTVRRTFPIVLAFDPAAGSLELNARLPPKLKLGVEQTFADCLLGHDLGEYTPRAAYELDRLRESRFDPATDPEDGVTVDVRQVRLSFKGSGRQILLTADPDRANDMAAMLDEVLDREHVPWSAVHISLVKFCFAFAPIGGRKAGTLTFDVAYPHHCSLRNQQADRIAVAMKYLARWGIHVPVPGGPDLAAAG